MKVEVAPSAKEFLMKYENIMLQQEAVSQLVLYSAYQEKDNENHHGIFGAVITEEKLALLFCNVLPHNLVMYAVLPKETPKAAAALADYILEEKIKINGIIGRKEVCQDFINQYKKNKECTFVEKLTADILELRSLNELKPVEGIHRLAHISEVKMITDWMIEFQMETLTSEMDYEAALVKARQYINSRDVYIFETPEQKVVTMAITTRRLQNGIAIAYVYTPEEYRSQGYAATNMYYLSKALLAEGYQFCTLFADKENLLSHRAYEKVGFQLLEESYEYELIS